MNEETFQIKNIMRVAKALGNEINKFVFVGGSICPLLMENKDKGSSRPTYDVDIVISASTNFDFEKVADTLRKKGFKNDISSKVLCRWLLDDLVVDIMPDNKDVLGFTNSYYHDGMKHSCQICLSDSIYINILSLPWFFASKLEAYKNRGNNDPRVSHDIEDIIIVLDSRIDLTKDLKEFPEKLRSDIRIQCQNLLKNNSLRDAILYSLSSDNIETKINRVENFFGLL